ncbi:hypothetical protein ES703_124922 [subsurface metagenome]
MKSLWINEVAKELIDVAGERTKIKVWNQDGVLYRLRLTPKAMKTLYELLKVYYEKEAAE